MDFVAGPVASLWEIEVIFMSCWVLLIAGCLVDELTGPSSRWKFSCGRFETDFEWRCWSIASFAILESGTPAWPAFRKLGQITWYILDISLEVQLGEELPFSNGFEAALRFLGFLQSIVSCWRLKPMPRRSLFMSVLGDFCAFVQCWYTIRDGLVSTGRIRFGGSSKCVGTRSLVPWELLNCTIDSWLVLQFVCLRQSILLFATLRACNAESLIDGFTIFIVLVSLRVEIFTDSSVRIVVQCR